LAVKIRLTRTGRKKLPSYRVVVADSRMPRDGRFIEAIGFYDPKTDPSTIDIDADKAKSWLDKGAKPSNTVSKLLVISGVIDAPLAKKARARKTAPTAKTAGTNEPATKDKKATGTADIEPEETKKSKEAPAKKTEAPGQAETTEAV
jgi:small subunit ribosomal protein S16